MTVASVASHGPAIKPAFDSKPSMVTAILFGGLLAVGLLFTAYSVYEDIVQSGTPMSTGYPTCCSASPY